MSILIKLLSILKTTLISVCASLNMLFMEFWASMKIVLYTIIGRFTLAVGRARALIAYIVGLYVIAESRANDMLSPRVMYVMVFTLHIAILCTFWLTMLAISIFAFGSLMLVLYLPIRDLCSGHDPFVYRFVYCLLWMLLGAAFLGAVLCVVSKTTSTEVSIRYIISFNVCVLSGLYLVIAENVWDILAINSIFVGSALLFSTSPGIRGLKCVFSFLDKYLHKALPNSLEIEDCVSITKRSFYYIISTLIWLAVLILSR